MSSLLFLSILSFWNSKIRCTLCLLSLPSVFLSSGFFSFHVYAEFQVIYSELLFSTLLFCCHWSAFKPSPAHFILMTSFTTSRIGTSSFFNSICSFCVLGYSFIIASFLCQLFTHLFRFFYIVIRRRPWHPTRVLLPGKSHGRRSLVGCSPWGCEESDTTERLHFHFSLSCIGEGNGNPLQCSCLENPRDGGAWWAAVYGVAQSDMTEAT